MIHSRVFLATAMFLLGFLPVGAEAGCGLQASGDYECGGKPTAPPVIDVPTRPSLPIAGGNPVYSDNPVSGENPVIDTTAPDGSAPEDHDPVVDAAVAKIQKAMDGYTTSEAQRMEMNTILEDKTLEDINNYPGDLRVVNHSTGATTFMGQKISNAPCTNVRKKRCRYYG